MIVVRTFSCEILVLGFLKAPSLNHIGTSDKPKLLWLETTQGDSGVQRIVVF